MMHEPDPNVPVVVVTGFRPFLDVSQNPSQLLVESVQRKSLEPPSRPISWRTHVLDTVYQGMRSQIASLLSIGHPSDAPDAIVLTGYSSLAQGLKIEARANSLCSPKFADASGFTPQPETAPIRTLGNNVLDLPALVTALDREGIPAELSDNAGEYVCNHSYWHALDLIARHKLPTRPLFLHIPAIEGADDNPEGAGSMSLEEMRRGLAITVSEVLSQPT